MKRVWEHLDKVQGIVSEVGEVVRQWPKFAREAGVDPETIALIEGRMNSIAGGGIAH